MTRSRCLLLRVVWSVLRGDGLFYLAATRAGHGIRSMEKVQSRATGCLAA